MKPEVLRYFTVVGIGMAQEKGSDYMRERKRSDQEIRRYEELETLRQKGIEPYPYQYHRTHKAQEILTQFSDEQPEAFRDIAVAGRIMALRRMGKVTFCHIQDETGKIQLYFRKNDLGERYDLLKLLDIGDIIGANGFVFRTRTGEITVHVQQFQLLAKSLTVLPIPKETIEDGKRVVHHPFRDKELRYRRRYLDLIVNPEVREIFRKRAEIIRAIRQFFDERGWLEVETPILQPIYGGAFARPFVTHHNALDIDLYLRIATELYLKRLIVGGYEGVYEIGKNFRNEGMDRMHNPEFTALELYVAYKDYNWMMELVEQLLLFVVQRVFGTSQLQIGDHRIDFAQPYKRLPLVEAIQEATGLHVLEASAETLRTYLREHGIDVDASAGKGKLIDELFSEFVQPHLVQPTFIIDYPIELSPLAKRHRTKPGLTERFELFIAGTELANAFSELNDPIDQRQRFEEQARLRAGGDEEAMVIDEDFLYALEVGMPPTAGLGIGIDRLVMLLLNQDSIREVILFPQMRPEHTPAIPAETVTSPVESNKAQQTPSH